MTEKNIFAYKLFLSINISDFNLFLCENCNPPRKIHPLFPSNPPLKVEVLSSLPHFLKIWLEAQPAPLQKGGGARYGQWLKQILENKMLQWGRRFKFHHLNIWMYTKHNNMLYCFRYEIFPFKKYLGINQFKFFFYIITFYSGITAKQENAPSNKKKSQINRKTQPKQPNIFLIAA